MRKSWIKWFLWTYCLIYLTYFSCCWIVLFDSFTQEFVQVNTSRVVGSELISSTLEDADHLVFSVQDLRRYLYKQLQRSVLKVVVLKHHWTTVLSGDGDVIDQPFVLLQCGRSSRHRGDGQRRSPSDQRYRNSDKNWLLVFSSVLGPKLCTLQVKVSHTCSADIKYKHRTWSHSQSFCFTSIFVDLFTGAVKENQLEKEAESLFYW